MSVTICTHRTANFMPGSFSLCLNTRSVTSCRSSAFVSNTSSLITRTLSLNCSTSKYFATIAIAATVTRSNGSLHRLKNSLAFSITVLITSASRLLNSYLSVAPAN